MSLHDIPDHPVIQNLMRTGYPDGKEPTYPHCPVCGRECEIIYRNEKRDPVGCEICTTQTDAWEAPECFPEKE